MGQAREAMDRVTEALFGQDFDTAREVYAQNAEAVSPDEPKINGSDAIVEYLSGFFTGFPDARFEVAARHEDGNTAIDEGYFVGTNTGDLELPGGETIPPTGKSVRVRACDIATVENGQITSHRFYWDVMDFMTQLGLAPEG